MLSFPIGGIIMNNPIPHHLLSNFLTHSYFDLLEQLCQTPTLINSEAPYSKDFMKSLKSFIFIFQNNSRNTKILQESVFKYYQPYKETSLHEISKLLLSEEYRPYAFFSPQKRNLTFENIRKTYHKTIRNTTNTPDYTLWNECNISFIKLHRQLVYCQFSSITTLPLMLQAPTAKDFILKAWLYAIDSLLSAKAYDLLLSTVHSFYKHPFESSPYLLTYLHQQVDTLNKEDATLSSFKHNLVLLASSDKKVL